MFIGAVAGSNSADFTIATGVDKTASYIKSDGSMKILYRTIIPLRNGNQPAQYMNKVDQFVLKGLPS